jgi:Nif-specific regulatory protein
VDLDEALRTVVDGVIEAVGADRGTLYLVDHAKTELVSHVAHLPEIAEIGLRVGVGEAVPGWMAERGDTVHIPEGQDDARFERRVDAETAYVTRSMRARRSVARDGCGSR